MSSPPSNGVASTPWRYIRLTIPASELAPGDWIIRWYEGEDQVPCEERLWPVIHVSQEAASTSVQCRRWYVLEWKNNPTDLMAADLGGEATFGKDELVDVLRPFNADQVDADEIARSSARATEPWG